MKFSFKITAFIISILMGGVFLYQVHWINGLYQTMSLQQDKNIIEAMAIADQNELFMRVEILDKDTSSSSKLNVNADMDQVKNDTNEQKKFYAYRDSNRLKITQKTEGKNSYKPYKENSKTTERLAAYLQKGMHQAVDHILPLNFPHYDSTLRVELTARNIRQQYVVQCILLANDSVCTSLPVSKGTSFKNFRKYDYPYDMDSRHAFRLYIKDSNRQVLTQMAGILSTSIVIFILLIFIFIYLLRTIRKLQTEEELKTNFTNNMTHELKTPIAVSYAAVDALLVSIHPLNPERQQKYLNIAKEQMQHLTCLVEQILSMSRNDNKNTDLRPEKIILSEMVTNLIDKFKLLSEKEIHFVTDLQNIIVVADKMHLYNMINNLIENGVKYSNNPVIIHIKAFKDTNGVSISVEDNGLGIEPRYQSRVFDKFYRIPTGNLHNVKGYGLGLFYVKEMAEKHGGTVFLKSQPGKASLFTIKIPQ